MNKRVCVVVVCEDKQQDVFIRRLLHRLNYNTARDVTFYRSPKGCAEQFVRQRYQVEVGAFRGKLHHRAGCLIAVIDADNHTVDFRNKQLKDSLSDAGLEDRQADESIAIFIPKWHIETWIHYLLGDQQVIEGKPSSYYDGRERDCFPAVERFIEISRLSSYPADCPPSLQAGLNELKQQRIPRV